MCLDLGMRLDLGIGLDLGMWLDWVLMLVDVPAGVWGVCAGAGRLALGHRKGRAPRSTVR